MSIGWIVSKVEGNGPIDPPPPSSVRDYFLFQASRVKYFATLDTAESNKFILLYGKGAFWLVLELSGFPIIPTGRTGSAK